MINITTTQARQRFAALPEIIQDAMFSQKNGKIISAASEQNHLSEERAADVAKAVGWVFLGFVHPEDLAKEIRDSAGIDFKIAANIADYIDSKIFQPIRNELEQIYAPSPKEEKAGPPKPVAMEEIKKPLDATQGKPEAATSVLPPPPMLSAMPEQKGPLSAPFAAPFPSPKAAPGAAVPAKIPAPGQAPAAIPFMLHQESELQPAPIRTGFKIGLKEEQFGKAEQKWMPPPKPAQIETSPVPKPAQEAKKEERVVHYNNEMRTPIPPAPSRVEVPAPAAKKAGVPPPPPGTGAAGHALPNPFGAFNNISQKFPPQK